MMPLIKHYPTNLIIVIHLSQYHQYTIRDASTLNTLGEVVFITVDTIHKYGQLVFDYHVVDCLGVYTVYVGTD